MCCVRPASRARPEQVTLYQHFLSSKAARRVLKAGKSGSGALSAITSLRKLCNHPKLIYDAVGPRCDARHTRAFGWH
jgi:SNF2 family DNA or RNA helicase